MMKWLENTVHLPQYYELLVMNGYESLDFVKEIKDRDELSTIGIILKGHQTKFLAAIRKLQLIDDDEDNEQFIPDETTEIVLKTENHNDLDNTGRKIDADLQYTYEGNAIDIDETIE